MSTRALQRTESKSIPANMNDMPGRRLLTASLFGGLSEELTGEQSKLDMELQTLVKHESGVSEFLSKWPEEKWLPGVVDKYRKQLKQQYAAVVKDLGGD
jgi:hypothetical protein